MALPVFRQPFIHHLCIESIVITNVVTSEVRVRARVRVRCFIFIILRVFYLFDDILPRLQENCAFAKDPFRIDYSSIYLFYIGTGLGYV